VLPREILGIQYRKLSYGQYGAKYTWSHLWH